MGAFAGRVFAREPDGSIGEALERVELVFRGDSDSGSATTGSNGSYRVELPNGAYEVVAEADGFEVQRTRAILRSDLQTLNVFLDRAAATASTGIHGRVFVRQADGSIGDPVAGAKIAARRRGFAKTTLTNDSGGYSLEVPRGIYILDGRAEGLVQQSTRVIVRDGMGVANLFLKERDVPQRPLHPDVCTFAKADDGSERTGEVLVPGGGIAELTYRVVDGKAVLEGGIVLGDADRLAEEVAAARRDPPEDADVPQTSGVGTVRQALVALGSRDKLWEAGLVPFQIDESNALLRRRIDEAMDHITANTNVEFIPASDRFDDRIVIRFSRDPNSSRADLGRQGGVQEIVLNPWFDVGGIVHEILHGLGVFHEQTRNDRDTFVNVNFGNIIDGREGNFRKAVNRGGVDIGPYDYFSVMHYSAWAFGKDDPANPGSPLVTIDPVDPAVSRTDLGSARDTAPFLSPRDIAGLNRLYPSHLDFDGGHLWGDGNYTTGVALGDVDGDGRDELIVARRAGGNGRYFVLNDADRDFATLIRGGESWGSGNYATCCATGDIDGDGRDEVVIGRKAGSNLRFLVSKISASPWREDILFTGGESWGDGNFTTDVAVGVDASGTPLIGVARKAGGNARFFVFAGAGDGFRLLFSGGASWGGGNYATGIAFGDVDGDGRLELGVARRAGDNARWFVLKDMAGDYTDFRTMHSGGVDWGSGNYATGIAFGDTDGDGRDEVAIARRAGGNGRYFVFDDADENFRLLETGGEGWGSGNYATAVALGDVDGDGRAELAVARKAGENPRVFLFDDDDENYRPLWDDGRRWGEDFFATCVALGNARGAGRSRHIAVGRKASVNHRFSVSDYNP